MTTPCNSLVVLSIQRLIQQIEKCACRSGLNILVSELGVPMTRTLYEHLASELRDLQLCAENTQYVEAVDDAVQAFAAIATNNHLAVRLAADPKAYHRSRVMVCRICRLVCIYLRECEDTV